MADIAEIEDLLAPAVSAEGFDLVRVMMTTGEGGRTLQVMAEDPATGQLLIDQCARLSRALSEILDVADPIEEEYSLEVSSPGIDRPLTRRKDFELWAGHKAKVSMREAQDGGRKKFQGRLAGLDGDAVKLRPEDGGDEDVLLPLEEILSAKLVLTDELIEATRPKDLN